MGWTVHVGSAQTHLAWDNSLSPAATVAPGDELELELLDASGGQITTGDDEKAIARLDFATVNPCTGPVLVEGAQPGDDLIVTLLGIDSADWGWTANIPGFGLLADDFPEPYLRISAVREDVVTFGPGIAIPARRMIGTIGVAKAAPGPTPLLVPTAAGGNMDIAQMGLGTRLHLPVQVPGALFSAGDTHAVQGDGEVCGTGVETPATLHVRFDVVAGAASPSPWYEYEHIGPGPDVSEPRAATTGIGPDLFAAARAATRHAVELVARSGLDPIDAYLLLSLVGELRVSEIVDAPNWVVSMHVPHRFMA
jgi:acetamidase/formamidase